MKTPADVLATDPLSDVTRKERRTLVAVSALGIVVAKSGLIPSRISALGIEFAQTDQQVFVIAVALVVLYFLAGFALYASSDFVAWRLAFWRAVDEAAQEHAQAQDAEVRRRKVFWLRTTFWVSLPRGLFEFVAPVVLALYAAIVLFAASPRVREQPAGEQVSSSTALKSASAEPIFINVPGRTITLATADWRPMENQEPFAENFETRRKAVGEAFPQVVTIFKLAMSERDRVGVKITDTEYAEFMVLHPGKVTLQLRLDRGGYWVLSRQTFDQAHALGAVLEQYRPFLPESQNRSFLEVFDSEVKRTRHQLAQLFPP